MIPQFLIKPLIGVAIVAIAFCIGLGLGWSKGTESAENKYKVILADMEVKAAQDTQAAQQRVAAIDRKRSKEKRDAQTQIDDLTRRIHSGAVRLSIPANCPGGVPRTASDPGVGDGAPRAELDRETSADLVAITGDGDEAIRQLNTCQDILEGLAAR
jgi:prophage endopeptidase